MKAQWRPMIAFVAASCLIGIVVCSGVYLLNAGHGEGWDQAMQEISRKSVDAPPISAIAFSQDSKTLLACGDGMIFVWDVSRGDLLWKKKLPLKGAQRAICLDDGTFLVGGPNWYRIDIARRTVEFVSPVAGTEPDATTLLWSRDQNYLVYIHSFDSKTRRGRAALWNVFEARKVAEVAISDAETFGVSFSGDGKYVGFGQDSEVAVHTTADGSYYTGIQSGTPELPRMGPRSIAFVGPSRLMAFSDAVEVIVMEPEGPIDIVMVPSSGLPSLFASQKSFLLAVVDQTVAFYDARDGKLLVTLPRTMEVVDVAFGESQNLVAVAFERGIVVLSSKRFFVHQVLH